MLLARRTAALEARKGAAALGSSTQAAAAAAAAGHRHRDRTEGPDRPRPLPPKERVRSALLHTLATPVVRCAPSGDGGGGRILNRLKVAGGDAPGSVDIRTAAAVSAAALARRKSTAAALMDESEADPPEGSAVGSSSQGEDGDGGRLTSFRLTGERTCRPRRISRFFHSALRLLLQYGVYAMITKTGLCFRKGFGKYVNTAGRASFTFLGPLLYLPYGMLFGYLENHVMYW